MPGPYFTGQEAFPCGCFFPDVQRLRDMLEEKVRVYHCTTHGEYKRPLLTPPIEPLEMSILTEEERQIWRNLYGGVYNRNNNC
jgi:hypothetical protein